jgi:hypothetical protein
MVLVFGLVAFTLARGSLQSSWKSHTASERVEGFDRPEDHRFDFRLATIHFEGWGAAAACVMVAIARRRIREISFPVTLLLTAIVIHKFHRPWWNYYYLHFAIPIAWLGSWAVSAALGRYLDAEGKGRFDFGRGRTWASFGLCAAAALVIARSEQRLEGIVTRLRRSERIEANRIVKELRKRRGSGVFVYSESGMYPFHARLPVLPQLAIVMPKRFWSGQITTTQIIQSCRIGKLGLIVIPRRALDAEWKRFLDGGYRAAATDAEAILYLRERHD